MPKVISQGYTIVDYLDMLLELNTIKKETTLFAVQLNKYEWIQLLSLYKMNYKACQSTIQLTEGEPFCVFKDINVCWDGLEDNKHTADYINRMEDMRYEIIQHHNTEERPATTAHERAVAARTNGRFAAPQPIRGYDVAQATPTPTDGPATWATAAEWYANGTGPGTLGNNVGTIGR